TAAMIDLVRKGGIKVILVEPFYDTSAPDQIAAAAGAKVLRVPTSVGGVEQARDYLSMMDHNVRAVASALK
ncbi:MAG: Zinc-uptake complex component periplasmic, partial [Bacteroidetes bacterium]|nr:Zinc-uptake complex component periplasmic [Bacteroidota bacterium]